MSDYTTLIDVKALAALLEDPRCLVLDCRFDLARPDWGERAFAEGHIPGAIYAHLDRDLSAPITASSGRHPLPDPEVFAARAGAWGIDESVQVVAYDQSNGMYAARAWWLLRWLGHARVAVLDGGLAAWCAAGRPLSSSQERPRPRRRFVARPNPALLADANEVTRALASGTGAVVDARAADRFAGLNETIDPVAGHVPGASNHPFARNLEPSGRFLAPEQLREQWLRTLGERPSEQWIAMCGSGVSACHNLLALERADLRGARLYAGSWSEWIRDPARPVATGSD